MDPNRWKQIDSLVDAALDVPEGERDAFIKQSAHGDADLERAVLELLAAQGQSSEFLQHSAMRIVAQAIAVDQPEVKSPSLIGQKVATYRIEKLLGAGGMGQVYLAFDEKLRRNVALKILPEEYGKNDERVRRFELEARAISKINHPNIVTIYDVGNAEGIYYIATEYVEGETLRDLSAGRFKLRNVMANSIQICDALSAAHAEGIIHRDIKPENVMIRRDGYAKILDFGVAKLSDVGPETMSQIGANTVKGMMIGTPAYMSPAQISGDQIDHRTDIWSAGVVLYEFLTGKNPFKGSSRQKTFEAVLSSKPPPPSSINPEVPPEVDAILEKLFSRENGGGYATAIDLRADLKAIKRELDSSTSIGLSGESSWTGRARLRNRRWPLVTATTFLGLTIVVAATWAIFFRGSSTGTEWTRATNVPLTDSQGVEFFPSIAPDGKSFVFAGETGEGYDIYFQRVGGKTAQNLTPNSPATDTQPAYSPNGELIAFRSDREEKGIYLMTEGGENVRRLTDFGFHPSWSPDGKEIVVSNFGRDQPNVREVGNNGLWIVNVESGAKREVSKVEASFPTWSPHNKRIAYWYQSSSISKREIATIPVEGGEPVIVAQDFATSNWNPVWSPDGRFLYFVSSRAGSLNFWRVQIDEISGAILSEPEPVGTPSNFSRHISFSRDGKRMIYVQTSDQANIQGVEFNSKTRKTVGEPFWITQGDREITRPELSPDGTRFLMRAVKITQDDIVTVNRDGKEWRDVTNDAPFDRYARWSPDGKQAAFYSDRGGTGEVWAANADGTNIRQLTFQNSQETASGFPIWSPDGKYLMYTNLTAHLLDLSKDWKDQTNSRLPTPAPIDRFVAWDWSPDGKRIVGTVGEGPVSWLAYYSIETGTYKKIGKLRAVVPSWLPDNRHVIYVTGKKIMIVDSETGSIDELLSSTTVRPGSPFVSRDGKLLYYAGHTYESNIWLLDLTDKP